MKIIKLSTDYHCWPLWGVSPNELGNINPNDLPISEELKNKLNEWADIYDSTLNQEYPPNSGFDSKEQEQLFLWKERPWLKNFVLS